MTLRRKFGLLLVTVLVTPPLLAMAVGFLTIQSLRRDPRLRDAFPLNRLTVEAIRKSIYGSPSGIIANGLPMGRYVLIRRADRVVVQSAVDAFPVGGAAEMSAVEAYFAEVLGEEKLGVEFIRDANGHQYTLAYPVRTNAESGISKYARPSIAAGMALLAAAVVAGALFLNRTTRSILRLQEATKRLAEGDLEFHVPEVGSDEIRGLAQSFVRMRERLKEEARQRSRFLMAVSHDLATPLTSIEGYIEAIRDGFAEGNPDRMNRYLDIIDQKSRVLASRVEGLIESARMETGEWRLKHQDVRLRGYLDQTAAVFREDALVAGRQFTSSVDIDPAVVVRMDPVLVTRALENLLSNAIRYTTAGDSVAFRALAPPGAPEATIVVEDTGRGIPADELGRIFDPFYRGPPVSRGGGYGIGLSTANHVITSHGWRIDVTSAPGAGTVLAIRIPLEGSEDGASAGAEDQGAPPETRDAG